MATLKNTIETLYGQGNEIIRTSQKYVLSRRNIHGFNEFLVHKIFRNEESVLLGQLACENNLVQAEEFFESSCNSEPLSYQDILMIAEEKALEVETFDSFFQPSEDEETGCPKLFETYDEAVKAEALKYAASPDQLYRHIWTVVDGDSGDLIVLNGWHLVNRVHYMVTKTPWGDGSPADADVYIEAQY